MQKRFWGFFLFIIIGAASVVLFGWFVLGRQISDSVEFRNGESSVGISPTYVSKSQAAKSSSQNSPMLVPAVSLKGEKASHQGQIAGEQKLNREEGQLPKKEERLLQDSEIPSRELQDQSESTRLSGQSKKFLSTLREMLVAMELRRCDFKFQDFADCIYAQVIISRPSSLEKSKCADYIMECLPSLPEEARLYFIVDGQRMIDRYLHFAHDYIVLFVKLSHHSGDVAQFGRYWEFFTNNPANYRISDEPDPSGNNLIIPKGMPAFFDKPWIGGSFTPPERYSHLIKEITR
jgi:hypothetical protein